MVSASARANSRTFNAAGPSPPDKDRGNPTTTSIADRSATMPAMRDRSPFPRRTVSTGVASMPDGSHSATPILASPGSRPIRAPNLIAPAARLAASSGPSSSDSAADLVLDVAQRLVGVGHVGAPTLCDVILPAAATAERGRRCLDQSVRGDAPRTRLVVHGHHDGRFVIGRTDDGHHARLARRHPTPDVERELAHVAGTRSVSPVRHDVHAKHICRVLRQLPCCGEQRGNPDPLDLLLRVAQPLDHRVDAVRQPLRAHLERLAELCDEHMLAGKAVSYTHLRAHATDSY